MMKHKYWSYLCVGLFLSSLLLTSCGQSKATPAVLSESTPPESNLSGDDSGEIDYSQEDSLSDLSSGGADTAAAMATINGALDTVAKTATDNATVQAINTAKPALENLISFLDLFRNYGNDDAITAERELAQRNLLRAKFEAAVAALQAAHQTTLAALFDEIKEMKPVLRIRSIIGTKTRYYYVSEASEVPRLRARSRIKNQGVAFMLWNVAEPVSKIKFPDVEQILTKPVYGCSVNSGGTFVSNESNCEGRSGISANPKLLGFSSQVADAPELEIQRFRARSDRYKFLVTIRTAEKAKTNLWNKERNLGGAAIPRLVLRRGPPGQQPANCVALRSEIYMVPPGGDFCNVVSDCAAPGVSHQCSGPVFNPVYAPGLLEKIYRYNANCDLDVGPILCTAQAFRIDCENNRCRRY